MTRKLRRKAGSSYRERWTREEQIENTVADGTEDEMQPPLTDDERAAL